MTSVPERSQTMPARALRTMLKSHYHAALAMLGDVIALGRRPARARGQCALTAVTGR